MTENTSPEKLALDAVDAWFGDKIKILTETHHQANIANASQAQLQQAAHGVSLAIITREEMRKLVNGL